MSIFNKLIKNKIHNIFYVITVMTFCCCSDREHTNPVDHNVDIIAPNNLQLSQQNIHTVLLSWDFDGDKYVGFLVDRKISSGSWQIAYDTIANNVRSYSDTLAIPAESHTYRVGAFADENKSDYVTDSITLIFPEPSNLQLTQLSDTTVALQWQDNSDGEDGFTVDRKKDNGTWEIDIKKTSNTTWIDSTVFPGSTYFYQIKAFKGTKTSTAVESQYQNILHVPGNLSAVAVDDQSLQLSWTDNCGYENGFRIERNDGSGFTQIAEVIADVTTYTDNELTLGQSYSYRIKVFTDNNESDYSNEIQASTVFPAPSSLSASVIDDQSIQLNWTDNCSFELGYRIERNDGSGFVQVGEVNPDVITYTDEGLTYDQSYSYRVRAFTTKNESNYSNEISASTVLTAPSDLATIAIDDQSLLLTWTDNTSYESGFRVEKNDGSGYTQIAEVDADVTTYTDNGLTYGQSYSYRVRAFTDSNQSDYSNEYEINTATVIDIDGNVYKIVIIGDQWWMAENLKVTHYRNGDAIPKITDSGTWADLSTSAYCNYNNNNSNADTYGSLYNWYAVNDSRNIAPVGWHIPSIAEWQTLEDYLGGSSVAGGKMKEIGTDHWESPNTGATNESGFTTLPGGYRSSTGTYSSMGNRAGIWSSTEVSGSSYSAYLRALYYGNAMVSHLSDSKKNGYSVRCVRD